MERKKMQVIKSVFFGLAWCVCECDCMEVVGVLFDHFKTFGENGLCFNKRNE